MVRHYSSAMSIGCVLVLIAAIAACARAEGSLVKAPDDSPICDWYSEECQQFKLTCTYGITKSVAAEGCERCVCAAPSDCKQQYEACQQLQCKYGVDRTLADDGCKQCSCTEDPCVSTKCSANKTCVTGHSKNPVTHEVKYSAHCIPVIIDAEDSTEVAPECRKAAEDCKVILCEYKVQRSRTGGCERCTCVTKDVDCGQLAHDCDTLNCTYGLNMTKGSDGCNRCSCLENPCLNKQCPVDKKCVVIPPNVPQTEYSANCRAEPRYETAYACEGKTLKIGCAEGSVIHLIRGNYGRFSMTICNDHGNTDWSVNCMSTRSLRVLHSRCSMHQNCSILASTNMFGDPCPNTLKYLEAHYQCVPASTTSTTTRPSPPWLITSQPTVWRSTAAPLPKNPVQPQQNETKKPTVITPPTFRPHITLPPEVKLGDVGTKKTTTRLPDSSSEPPSSSRDVLPDLKEDIPRVFEPDLPKKKKPVKEEDNVAVTEESMQWPVKDEDSDLVVQVHHPPKERPADTVIVDDYDRSYTATCLEPVDTGSADCGASAERRWYYSVHRGECIVFTFQGCEGTKNNFKSYGECADVCAVTASEPDDSSKCDRYSEECQQLEQTCAHGMTVSVAAEGCERCACAAPPDCRQHHEACQRLECKYSVDRTLGDDGCEQCSCTEDPCSNTNCSSKEKCVAAAYMNPDTNEIQYSANCAPDEDTNEVTSECEEAAAGCKALRCAYGVQRTRVPGDCERCACVTEDVDCGQLAQDCERLKCTYGMARTRGSDGCDRCSCLEHPCSNQQCPEGERCVATPYRDPVTQETKYSADCRTDVPQAPQLSTETEPEVTASEGGKATLRCIFHGKPPPKITWKLGEITIDGNVGRYRLLSDGALEIVSLYRNDSGVYICVGDNGLGVARQEIRLLVSDPVKLNAGISGEQGATVRGEMDGAAVLRCLAYGLPEPSLSWYRDIDGVASLVPFSTPLTEYVERGRVLLIRRLTAKTLGEYMCLAYNNQGKPATWHVVLQAYQLENEYVDSPYIVPREQVVEVTPPRRTTETTTATTPAPEIELPFVVPVQTALMPSATNLVVGRELSLPCEVDGYPEPQVTWTKDNVRLLPNDRMWITNTRLTIHRVSRNDSGVYACHAANSYSQHESRVEITVTEPYVPAKCIDNPYVASCALIVQGKFCTHKYYSRFCCKSCVEAGQLDPSDIEPYVPAKCIDNPYVASCALIVQGKFCTHKYYSRFCCKSCVEAGQLDPSDIEPYVPAKCIDNPYVASCALIVQGKFCTHKYYSRFCCKSCVEAGQLDPSDIEMQGDAPFRKK